ncbi:hypothetical protein ASG35_06200 [Burkholderia sp. Leaf177]|nr:hypothetical protein ASG35_06200 [Burkholderia sp. Leaf177]
MSKPHILILGGWTELVEKALGLGMDVSYLGSTKGTSYFDADLLKDCAYACDANIERIGLCLAQAKSIHRALPLTAVVSFSELGLETAAVIADNLRISGLDLDAVLNTRYKDTMRAKLSDYPDLQLPWKRVRSEEDLKHFFDQHGPGIIVKPINGAASQGVHQIRSAEELERYVKSGGQYGGDGILAEMLIDSDKLYSIESLSVDGRHDIITMSLSKLVGYPYSLVSHTVVPPYGVEPEETLRIANLTRTFLSAIDLKNGVAHTEVKVGSDARPFLIESQTRVGGDRIWKMAELTSGVHQIDMALDNLVGRPVDSANAQKLGVAGFFCFLPPAGVVKAVCDPGFLKIDDAVIEYEFNVEAGDLLIDILDNTQRKGYVCARALSHDDLFEHVARIYKNIWIEYEDGSFWRPSFA